MLKPLLIKNEKLAKLTIGIFSVIVFCLVLFLNKFKLNYNLGFNVHLFAKFNCYVNISTSVVLCLALFAVLVLKNYALHRNLMFLALFLSLLFLLSYVSHHLFSNEFKFGDVDGDGFLSSLEINSIGILRFTYLFLLITHIILASLILPFILYTSYSALIADYDRHKKIARYTWPLWLYVTVTGPIVYFFISPYYR